MPNDEEKGTHRISFNNLQKMMERYNRLKQERDRAYEGEQEEDPAEAIINKGMKIQDV